MSKHELIEMVVNKLKQLPVEKIEEATDYISFILQKYDEELHQKGIERIAAESGSFDFLKDDDDDLYTLNDAIEIYT